MEDWTHAFDSYAAADAASALPPDDVMSWARAAYMTGRDDDYVALLERAHRAYLDSGRLAAAVRCTWWIGHNLLFHGQGARAGGWFSVGTRLLEEYGEECVERGYLLIPQWLQQMGGGDWAGGLETARQGEDIATRFDDADLLWLARDEQARALVRLGRVAEGLRLVDELLVVVDAGTVSPVVSGIIYCNTIAFCRDVFEERHAREWTEALSQWCDQQPGMVAHNGLCLVHKAEVQQLRGQWPLALDQARVAAERFTAGALNQIACGKAHYRQGELHRLQGRYAEAEESFAAASRHGCEPQPGLALVRLAQGKLQPAEAAIRRAVSEHVAPLERVPLLPAYVEIMVAVADLDAADAACRELDGVASARPSESLLAMADHARAIVAQARGDLQVSLSAARSAWRRWHGLEAPYEAARARVLVALACRGLGDEDSAELELAAARDVFESLGAVSDLHERDTAGLSGRELEVLRLVATGSSNRQIATALVISERTVARHLQNIFAKLDVGSRTAASTFALEHGLV